MVNELNEAKPLIMYAAAGELGVTFAPWRRNSNTYFWFKHIKKAVKQHFTALVN